MPINPIASNAPQLASIAKPAQPVGEGGDFGRMLTDALKEVNSAQQNALGKQEALMANQPVEYHDLMITMERANIAMQLTLQVRNKVLEAFQEIQRMQV